MEVIICQGLPASGKSTWAKDFVARNPRYIRVNRDDIRAMMHCGRPWSKDQERLTKDLRDAAIINALQAGRSVIVDDTNLDPTVVKGLSEMATNLGASVRMQTFLEVPLDECLARNQRRPNPVPEKAIMEMHERYLHKEEDRHRYRPMRGGLRSVILCDLDGTLAINRSGRSFYDAARCEEDDLNHPVAQTIHAMVGAYRIDRIVFMSGREEKDREPTERWLKRHFLVDGLAWELHMRATGDQRGDDIVKRELFEAHVEAKYNVLVAFDDRNRVVKLWRSLGIPCFQVAEGDF